MRIGIVGAAPGVSCGITGLSRGLDVGELAAGNGTDISDTMSLTGAVMVESERWALRMQAGNLETSARRKEGLRFIDLTFYCRIIS